MLNFLKISLMLALLWIGGLAWFVHSLTHVNFTCDKPCDGIVVLTGGSGRIEKGLELLRQNTTRQLLISGVNSKYKLQKIVHNHVLPYITQIELGYAASTTAENALEAFFWVYKHKIQKICLVTADYHMYRARLNFQIVLPDVAINPCPVMVTKIADLNKKSLTRLIYEYHKLLATWFCDQVNKIYRSTL